MTPLRYFIASGSLGIFIDAYKDVQLWTLAESGGAPGARTFKTPEEAYEVVTRSQSMPADCSVFAVPCATEFCPLWDLQKAGFGSLLGMSVAHFLHYAEPAGFA